MAGGGARRIQLRGPRCGKRRSHPAFTLVEVIIALVLILVLSVLAITWTRSAKQRGILTRCLSNVRQTGIGVLAYAADHNNRLPGPVSALTFSAAYNETPDANGDHLYSWIWEYAGLPTPKQPSAWAKIAVCPSVLGAGKSDWWLSISKFFRSGLHYVAADQLVYPLQEELPNSGVYLKSHPFGWAKYGLQPFPINRISMPGQFALLGEMPGNVNNPTSYHQDAGYPLGISHQNKRTILYLDGHVETGKLP